MSIIFFCDDNISQLIRCRFTEAQTLPVKIFWCKLDGPHVPVVDINICFAFPYFVLVAQNSDEGV